MSKTLSNDFGTYSFSEEDASYYIHSTDHDSNQKHLKSLGYVMKHIFGYSKNELLLKYGLMVAIIDSKDDGFSEIIYNGISLSKDNRQIYVPYKICQRVPSNLAHKFLERAKQNPDIVETFFQTAFPKLQSNPSEYNGLYRPKINNAYLVNDKTLQDFIEKHPLK